MTLPLTERQFKKSFWSRVDKSASNGCWEWTGKINNYGYGICSRYRRELSAHRVSYEWKHGPIPRGMVIDHLCRNRKCVNPAHMEAVTTAENVLRGECFAARKKRQTHCIHGHPLSGSNLRIRPDGHRSCRACERIKADYYRHQQKVSPQ